jgi:hypothetical protein
MKEAIVHLGGMLMFLVGIYHYFGWWGIITVEGAIIWTPNWWWIRRP